MQTIGRRANQIATLPEALEPQTAGPAGYSAQRRSDSAIQVSDFQIEILPLVPAFVLEFDWPAPVRALISMAETEWMDDLETRRWFWLLEVRFGLEFLGSDKVELDCDCTTPRLTALGADNWSGCWLELVGVLGRWPPASERRRSPPPNILVSRLVM